MLEITEFPAKKAIETRLNRYSNAHITHVRLLETARQMTGRALKPAVAAAAAGLSEQTAR